MREAGSKTLEGVDFSVMRIVLYVNAALMAAIGFLAMISGIGMFLAKNWARLLWLGVLFLMAAWIIYSFVMSTMNRGFNLERTLTNSLMVIVIAALFYFFSRDNTRLYFKVN